MLAKDITYTNLDGQKVTEKHYFHLNKTDLAELELGFQGGLEETLRRIIQSQNGREIMQLFKTVIKQAYGIRSEDGRRFRKSEEIWLDFVETDAFSELFFELVTDAEKAAEFMRGIVPSDLAQEVEQNMKNVSLPEPRNAVETDEQPQAVENVFDNGLPEPEPVRDIKHKPAWILEDRMPTQTEMSTMSGPELREAFDPERAARIKEKQQG